MSHLTTMEFWYYTIYPFINIYALLNLQIWQLSLKLNVHQLKPLVTEIANHIKIISAVYTTENIVCTLDRLLGDMIRKACLSNPILTANSYACYRLIRFQ